MQSAAWGEFNQKQRGMTPHHAGLTDEAGNILAAALLLERKPPFFPPYLYCPRGFVIDFFDEELLRAFTDGVRAFAAKLGAMFLALDPDIELWEIDAHARHVEGGFDNHSLVERMLALGYRHRGYNRNFEGRQPRFTFRINLMREQKEIDRGIVGNVMKNVRKSRSYATQVERGGEGDIEELHRLITLTSERDEFVGYDTGYYADFFRILDARSMVRLYLGYVWPRKTADMLRESRRELLEKRKILKKPGPLEESRQTEQRLDREIALFDSYAARFPEKVCVSAHMVVLYGNKAWAVHAGSDKQMSETFVNNRVYYEKIVDVKQAGAEILDQFGTTGTPDEGNLRSLHEFKRQFGGRYIEFVGEFDLVVRPFWFFLYDKLLPVVRSARISAKLLLRRKN